MSRNLYGPNEDGIPRIRTTRVGYLTLKGYMGAPNEGVKLT